MNYMRDDMDGQREKVWGLKGLMPTQRLVLLALVEGWTKTEEVAEVCTLFVRQAEIILAEMVDRKLATRSEDGRWFIA